MVTHAKDIVDKMVKGHYYRKDALSEMIRVALWFI